MNRLLVVDGHYLAYRSYFAFPSHLSFRAQPINAVYGFIASLISTLESIQPTHLALCFDTPEPTFRHHLFSLYKAHRPPAPENFVVQIPILHELITRLGLPVLTLPGYEADDLVGTLTHRAEGLNMDAYVLSGDMDNMQLVSQHVSILVPQNSGEPKRFTPQEVVEKYGFEAGKVVFYKSLRGDPSDNIPGISGIGEKTATQLVQQFSSLKSMYERVDEIQSAKLREKVIANRESAEISEQLATIDRDVPLATEIESLRYQPDWGTFVAVFKEYEFNSLVKRFQSRLATPLIPEPVRTESKSPSRQYMLVDSSEILTALLPKLENGFAIDLESTAKQATEAQLVGISLSWSSGTACYIPMNQFVQKLSSNQPTLFEGVTESPTRLLPSNPLLNLLRPVLENQKIPKYTHHGKYEWLVLRRYGICLQGIQFDSMLAAFILYPGAPLGLKDLAKQHLGVMMTTYESLTGKGKLAINFSEVPIDHATQYAAADADMTFQLTELFRPKLIGKQKELFENIEIPLQIVLAEMEWAGVRVDVGYLRALYEDFYRESQSLAQEIFQLAGTTFNLNSPKQLSEILFERLGLTGHKKTKTGVSTDAAVLERLSQSHPIARHILNYRTLEKLNNTYVSVLPQLINPTTGRIHSSFNQCGAITGRLSSTNPNIQNIPIRTEAGRKIRKAFLPSNPDHLLLSADYSQIELRILAHLAEENALIQAFNNGEDIHSATAARIFHIDLESVTKEQRYQAKAVNFGIIYGQSAFGLSEALRIPRAEAKEIIDNYFAMFPQIQTFMSETIRMAESVGAVETLYGRVRPIPDIHSSNMANRQFAQRTAVNTRVQGSAADIIKIAMIRIQDQIKRENLVTRMIIQVHDELVFDCPKAEIEQVSALVKQQMMSAATLLVSLEVDLGHGTNWLEA